jgi:hypothetical protein
MALLAQGILYRFFSSISSVMNGLQNYCVWTLYSSEYISHGNCTLQLIRDDNIAVAWLRFPAMTWQLVLWDSIPAQSEHFVFVWGHSKSASLYFDMSVKYVHEVLICTYLTVLWYNIYVCPYDSQENDNHWPLEQSVKGDLVVSLPENPFGEFWPVRTGRNRWMLNYWCHSTSKTV